MDVLKPCGAISHARFETEKSAKEELILVGPAIMTQALAKTQNETESPLGQNKSKKIALRGSKRRPFHDCASCMPPWAGR